MMFLNFLFNYKIYTLINENKFIFKVKRMLRIQNS